MKNIIILILFFANFFFLNAQKFDTKYTKSNKSSHCGNESFQFSFSSDILIKTNNYDKSTEKNASRKQSYDFDNNGYYYELWSPKWFLDSYGIDEYRKIQKKAYKLLFNQKEGDLLYIFEFDTELGTESGRFYFTQAGYEIYCK